MGKYIYIYARHEYYNIGNDDFYVFRCADERCKSIAFLYVKTMKFENIKSHIFDHSKHYYLNKGNQYKTHIIDFIKKKFHEAQVFLINNLHAFVKYYD